MISLLFGASFVILYATTYSQKTAQKHSLKPLGTKSTPDTMVILPRDSHIITIRSIQGGFLR